MKTLLLAILLVGCSVGADGVPEQRCVVVTCEVFSRCNGLEIDEQAPFAGEPLDAYSACAEWQIAWQDACVAACPNAINWTGLPNTDACLLGGIAETQCEGEF